MMKFINLLLFAAVINSCGTPKETVVTREDNMLSLQERKDGWELLFDGSTLNNWHTYGYRNVVRGWEVVNGTIHLNTADKSSWPDESKDLLTDEEFEDFDFKYDWKISKNGNSGLIFYVKEDKAKYKNTYETGPEMQVLDNNGHPDAKIIKHRAGDLYDLITSSPETVKPSGEWNSAEIISRKGKLDFYLNGKRVVNTTIWSDNWKKLIAGSKFKTMPDFGTFKKGRIALQEHGDEVWYKNVMIRRL